MPQAALVAVAVLSTGLQMRQQGKAAKAQKKAMAEQRRQDELRATREKIQAIRAANKERAKMIATAANYGVSGSSGAQGGLSSIGSQLGGNLGYADTITQSNAIISNYGSKAVGYTNSASMFGDIAGLSFQGANFLEQRNQNSINQQAINNRVNA